MNRFRKPRAKRILAYVSLPILLPVLLAVGYNLYADYAIDQLEYENLRGRKIIFGERAGSGDGPAVLLIHGFDGTPLDWKPLTNVLRQAGRPYSAPLLTGHGVSPRLLGKSTAEDWINHAHASYLQLKRQHDDVVVVGGSMGASIALALAAREDVPTLILVSPYFRLKSRWYIPGQPESWAPWLDGIFPYLPKIGTPSVNDPTGRMTYKRFANFYPARAVTELYRAGTIAMESVTQVQSRTLWIHSRGDRMVDFELSREMFDALPTEDKCFIQYDRSNHGLLHDYDRADAMRRILQFIDGGCDAALSNSF